MMTKEEREVFKAMMFVALLSGALFSWVAYGITCSLWEKEAVQKGCANYNQTTGKWQWIQETEKKKGDQ